MAKVGAAKAKGGKGKGKAASSSSSKRPNKEVYAYADDSKTNRGRALGHDDDGASSDDEHAVKTGDDESVSDDGSDIGWDSDDEIAYGKIVNKGKGLPEIDPEEEDSDDDEDGGMLLSEMVKGTVYKAPAPSSSSSKEAADMEESDEDDEDEDGDDSEDEEDEGELEEVHNRLLSAIDKFSKSGADGDKDASGGISKNQDAPESVFAAADTASGSSSSSSGGGGNVAVSMDALLGALGESKDLNVVKSRLSSLEKGMNAAPVYVEKVHADRAERKVAYEGTATEMGKWQNLVSTNRSARTLDIAKDERRVPGYRDLVRKFEPQTGSMEEEIQMVLVKANATDATRQRKEEEDDELGGRTLTVAELRERQAELAKTKALLFYEQMKRHRINKIKSKSFHRIKKRQRLRKEAAADKMLEEADPEAYAAMQEEAATTRVRERMSLKHRSTSEFAKKMLKHAHGDKSMRAAYNDSVALGNELREKIEGEGGDDSDSDGDDVGMASGSDDDDDDDDGGSKKKRRKVAALAARALKASSLLKGGEEDDTDAPKVSGKYKKLFDMDFMKRAQSTARERAKEEAQEVLRELEGMEEGGSDDDDNDSDRGSDGGGSKLDPAAAAERKQRLKEAKEQMGALFGSGGKGGKASGLRLRKGASFTDEATKKSTSSSAAGDDDDDDEADDDGSDGDSGSDAAAASGGVNPWLVAPKAERSAAKAQGGDNKAGKGAKGKGTIAGKKAASTGGVVKASKTRGGQAENEIYVSLDSLVSGGGGEANVKPRTKKQQQQDKKRKEAEEKEQALADKKKEEDAKKEKEQQQQEKKKKATLLSEQSQQELVTAAFAGPDYSADFSDFKDKQVQQELGIDEKKMKIAKDVKAGWGDWAGPGQEVSTRILAKRDTLVAAVEADAALKKKGRKDNKMPNVMLSDRRVKTAAKYKISEDAIPHPFTSREEYEQSMRMPVGEEWNASHVVRANTKPEIMLRAGRIVEPAQLSKRVDKEAKDKRMSGTATAGGAGQGTTTGRIGPAGKNKRKFKG